MMCCLRGKGDSTCVVYWTLLGLLDAIRNFSGWGVVGGACIHIFGNLQVSCKIYSYQSFLFRRLVDGGFLGR